MIPLEPATGWQASLHSFEPANDLLALGEDRTDERPASGIADTMASGIETALVVLEAPQRVVSSRGFPREVLNRLRASLSHQDGSARPSRATVHADCFSHMPSLAAVPLTHCGEPKAILYIYDVRKRTVHQAEPATSTDIIEDGRTETDASGWEKLDAMAHALRTPITVIRGYLRMLIDGRQGPLTKAQKQCIATALECTNKVVAIVSAVQGRTHDKTSGGGANASGNQL